MKTTHPPRLLLLLLLVSLASLPLGAQWRRPHPPQPWDDTHLSPDERADLVLKQLTLDEKLALLHGTGQPGYGPPSPQGLLSNGGAGYVPGVPRLNIPGIQMADAAYGVTKSGDTGRYSTALPSDLGAAASWDPQAAYEYGALIGRELRDQGYSMSLGGGVDLAREPRNGRTFEYLGEDPILAGTMVGYTMKGLQAQHVIGDIKHYALNDQESGRNAVNANITHRAMRESDLLAFEIGLHLSDAQGVMCSYNRVNGDFACENNYLLNNVLKHDWKFPGFVLSDWGGTHSAAKASHNGLDNEEPSDVFFGDPLKKAVESGQVPMAEIDDHAHRMLRAEFAAGLVDYPVRRAVPDIAHGLEVAQRLEEQSIVLLRNQDHLLPLDRASVRTIAVIGHHADVGMISGGGSAQVDPPGGNVIAPPGQGQTEWQKPVWFPTSPLKSIRAAAPASTVRFDDGRDPARAAQAARGADVALVFVHQWESEGMDLDTLALGDNQDALVAAVAAANPHTVVVLENGSPVLMPWATRTAGIVESWYAGSRGAEAVARVLFGDVNPGAKLPLTFPLSDADLPHPALVKPPPESQENNRDPDHRRKAAEGYPAFQTTYDEALKVGYKWYDAEKKP
ncbi:MAG TPA: glycoside hydrolase family 3 C-terminal domain-containing protein, partial [Acidobacteriaceae bacterium]